MEDEWGDGEDIVLRASNRRFYSEEPIVVGGDSYTAEDIWRMLGGLLTESRQNRILEVCRNRSEKLVTVLENIYDRGNISAVMRTAEAFGFYRFHILDAQNKKFKVSSRVSKGTDKWLQVERFSDPEASVKNLKNEGYQILVTHLDIQSQSIEEIDFSLPTAVVFGNEKDGVSSKLRSMADGCFVLPMLGFVQSFNISVAAALTYSYIHYDNCGRDKPRGSSKVGAHLSKEKQGILAANYALRSFENPSAILAKLRKESSPASGRP